MVESGNSELFQTCKGEGAPNERPASLARAMPVFAHGPLAGEGVAASTGKAFMVSPGGTLHENLPVASGFVSLQKHTKAYKLICLHVYPLS